jgi:hypothetical protein
MNPKAPGEIAKVRSKPSHAQIHGSLTNFLPFPALRKTLEGLRADRVLAKDQDLYRCWYTESDRQNSCRLGCITYSSTNDDSPRSFVSRLEYVFVLLSSSQTAFSLTVTFTCPLLENRTLLSIPEIRQDFWKILFADKVVRQKLLASGVKIGVF